MQSVFYAHQLILLGFKNRITQIPEIRLSSTYVYKQQSQIDSPS